MMLRALSKQILPKDGMVEGPVAAHFDLPERVLQFGTGAFLRGFADFFVEKANRAGVLQGRVVLVGSTGSGRVRQFNAQDGLYTLYERGYEHGQIVERGQVVAAVSRALTARDQWADVLACARRPALALVVSNTTEVGITLDEEDRLDLDPPRSFPGKLTAVLYERARAFGYDPAKGLIILPCELVEQNGEVLRRLVRTLARRWSLGDDFLQWLDRANRFCNTLVDRIVPGTPDVEEAQALYTQIGYRDALLTVAEPYRLWAIEGDADLLARFPLANVDPGLIITEDITPYRERKVRILNGTHTLMVPAALLCGSETVYEAVQHPLLARFVRRVMLEEIVPGLAMAPDLAQSFARDVLDRFANPFIRHELLGITFQQTTKMRVRVIPSLLAYVDKMKVVPPSMAFGFACFLLYHHPAYRPDAGKTIADDAGAYWAARWHSVNANDPAQVRTFVSAVSGDDVQWEARLDALPHFVELVTEYMMRAVREGVPAALEAHLREVDA